MSGAACARDLLIVQCCIAELQRRIRSPPNWWFPQAAAHRVSIDNGARIGATNGVGMLVITCTVHHRSSLCCVLVGVLHATPSRLPG